MLHSKLSSYRGGLRYALSALLLLPAFACTGFIPDQDDAVAGTPGAPGTPNGSSGSATVNPPGGSSGGASGGGGAGSGSLPPTPTQEAPPSVPGAEAPRRLSSTEYRNTVDDLLLAGGAVTTADLPVDQQAGASGYLTGAALTSAPDARLLLDKATEVTASAINRLGTLVPCISMSSAGDACAREFITTFGRRAYRRPLSEDETSRLMALYTAQRGGEIGVDFREALRGIVMAMLQSPNFLYRWELGATPPLRDGALVRFNSNEMASRLSYSLWATMPDQRLFELADTDELSTVEQVQQEARRMISDTKAGRAYQDFATQWLSLTQLPFSLKDQSFNFTQGMARSMLTETGTFFASFFVGANATGSFRELMTTRTTFVDGTLAKIYGIPNVTGDTFKAVTLNGTERSGILTQLAFLTKHGDTLQSFPVRRGAEIYRRLFCHEIELPADMDVVPPPPATPGQTTRQRFAEHSKNPCAVCHKVFEPLGFGFENYDGLGRYRTMDNGQPVDATGDLSVAGQALKFDNAVELSKALSESDVVRDCFATQLTRFVLRRREVEGDFASVIEAQKAFRAASFDMRELLVAIVGSDAFSHRSPSPGEILQ